MKVLLIDCNSVRHHELKKCDELAKIKDVDLTLLVPTFYIENFKKNFFRKPSNVFYKIIIGRLFGKQPNRAIFLNGLLRAIFTKPDVICVHSDENFLLTFQVLLYKLLFSPQTKFIFHSWQNIYIKKHNYPQAHLFLYYLDLLVEKFVLKFSDACIVRNLEGLHIFDKKGFKKKLIFIPWGTDIMSFYKIDVKEVKDRYGLKGFIVGYMGRLVEEKGVLDLIRACNKLGSQDINLAIIGEGPLKKEILQIIMELNLHDKVKLIPGVPFKEVPLLLNCMDVLVLPSRTTKYWKEQFGRVLIEAMACEVPVIGSNSGAIPEVIGETGLIFEEGNIADLTSKINLLINNPDLKMRLGRDGRHRVIREFTWTRFAERTYDLFKDVLGIDENVQGA